MDTLTMYGLYVKQEQDTNELNTWYVMDLDTGDALMNEWFETEKEAQDLLEWYIAGENKLLESI